MKGWIIKGLKLLASVPIALVIGELASRILESGLWPLLLFSDTAIAVIHWVVLLSCQTVVWCAVIWYWILERE